MRFAVRNSGAAGRRRGHRPARLRVHDRRRRRRARTGRRQLRGRDDRWPGVPVRPERPAHRGARTRASVERDPPARSWPRARRRRGTHGRAASGCSRTTAPPGRRWPSGCSMPATSRDVFWVVEPVAVAAPAVDARAGGGRRRPRSRQRRPPQRADSRRRRLVSCRGRRPAPARPGPGGTGRGRRRGARSGRSSRARARGGYRRARGPRRASPPTGAGWPRAGPRTAR